MIDYLVIGAGSGGIASARRAASHGMKVAVVEQKVIGGTCVNLGCVPKKIMWETSNIKDVIEDSKGYGFSFAGDVVFDYAKLKSKRQKHIAKINGIFMSILEREGIEFIPGMAKFTGEKSGDPTKAPIVAVGDRILEASNILIATGSYPYIPEDVEGASKYGLTSDGFFSLDAIPKSAIMVGSGYISVELAHVLKVLGCSDVFMSIRFNSVLRTFDTLIQDSVMEQYKNDGIKFYVNSQVTKVDPVGPMLDTPSGSKAPAAVKVHILDKLSKKEHIIQVEKIFFAVGRYGNTHYLNLDKVGVGTTDKGFIKIDRFHSTTLPNVYAVGDVCGEYMLAPVAIAAGRHVADRLYKFKDSAHLSYDNIPSVIFSGIPCASIGLSFSEAEKRYGKDNIKVYNNKVRTLQTFSLRFWS